MEERRFGTLLTHNHRLLACLDWRKFQPYQAMTDLEQVLYSVAAFICALFLLEFGTNKLIDHTVVVARRARAPQTAIALLTAGAEWEEA